MDTNLPTRVFPGNALTLLYDVSHNTCKLETHEFEGHERKLYVHRKGATRALGPGHPDLPDTLKDTGQPVLIGGSMGTASHILKWRALSRLFASRVSYHPRTYL